MPSSRQAAHRDPLHHAAWRDPSSALEESRDGVCTAREKDAAVDVCDGWRASWEFQPIEKQKWRHFGERRRVARVALQQQIMRMAPDDWQRVAEQRDVEITREDVQTCA